MTYTDLKALIATWAVRNDLTARADEIIDFVESDLRVRCRLVDLESAATVAVVAGVGAVPSDFCGHRVALWEGETSAPLEYATPEQMAVFSSANVGGSPRRYTITSGEIQVSPSSDGSIALTYLATLAPLSDDAPTNALLTNYPDVYLAGCQKWVGLLLSDDARVMRWGREYEAAVSRVKLNQQFKRYPGQLTVRPA